MAHVLRDVLAPDLRLVICGSAAGTRSAELRQYYAHPGNKFWRTLHAVGLTPRQLAPAEYARLLEFGIGLTDVLKDQSGPDAQLDFARANPEALRAKILRYAPRWLCFSSKNAARAFLRRPVDYGVQPETLGETRLFVACSPSGAASGAWDVAVWHALAALVKAARRPTPVGRRAQAPEARAVRRSRTKVGPRTNGRSRAKAGSPNASE